MALELRSDAQSGFTPRTMASGLFVVGKGYRLPPSAVLQTVLTLSKAGTLARAVLEWKISDQFIATDAPHNCVCYARIQKGEVVNVIKNKLNSLTCCVGNCCMPILNAFMQ